MAETNLTETTTWETGIYQFATTDPVQGGPDGLDNKPTRQLANRTQYLRALCDALSASKAPLASPALTGTPTAPTAAAGTNTAQLANTAFVQSAISAAVSSAVSALVNGAPAALDTLKELAAAIGNDANFATTITNALAGKAPLASPALTGTPTAPTAAAGTNTTQLANTAFVQSTVAASVSSAIAALINGAPAALDTLTELATALGNDANFATTVTNSLAAKAPLASPALTGTPTAPTAAVGTNSTQLANTAFVVALLAAYGLAGPSVTKNAFDLNNATVGSVITVNGLESDAATYNWPSSGLAASASVYWLVSTSGVATRLMQTAIFPFAAGSAQGRMFVRLKHDANWSAWRELAYADMVAGKASLDSPAFTGTPTAPTAAAGTNSVQLANTAFVQSAVSAAVSSAIASLVNGSPAALDTLKELATALGNDANFATTITNALAGKAPLASPALTGVPTAPTAASGSNTAQLANTAFVQAALAKFGLGTNDLIDWTGDLNNLTTSGLWLAATSTNAPNTSISGWFVIVLANALGAYAVQLATPQAINEFWFRTSNNGTWSAWVKVAGTDSPALTGVPTAPTAGVTTRNLQLATTEFVQAAIDWRHATDWASYFCISGWIIQVGRINVANTGAFTTLTFPVAFPNRLVSFTGNIISPGVNVTSVLANADAATKTSIPIATYNVGGAGGGTTPIYYIAIGL